MRSTVTLLSRITITHDYTYELIEEAQSSANQDRRTEEPIVPPTERFLGVLDKILAVAHRLQVGCA